MTAITRDVYVAQQTALTLTTYDRRLRLIRDLHLTGALTDPADLRRRVTARAERRLLQLQHFSRGDVLTDA